MDTTSDRWTYKRSEQVSLPLEDILWHSNDGIDYLRPEVQLLHKAPGYAHRTSRLGSAQGSDGVGSLSAAGEYRGAGSGFSMSR